MHLLKLMITIFALSCSLAVALPMGFYFSSFVKSIAPSAESPGPSSSSGTIASLVKKETDADRVRKLLNFDKSDSRYKYESALSSETFREAFGRPWDSLGRPYDASRIEAVLGAERSLWYKITTGRHVTDQDLQWITDLRKVEQANFRDAVSRGGVQRPRHRFVPFHFVNEMQYGRIWALSDSERENRVEGMLEAGAYGLLRNDRGYPDYPTWINHLLTHELTSHGRSLKVHVDLRQLAHKRLSSDQGSGSTIGRSAELARKSEEQAGIDKAFRQMRDDRASKGPSRSLLTQSLMGP